MLPLFYIENKMLPTQTVSALRSSCLPPPGGILISISRGLMTISVHSTMTNSPSEVPMSAANGCISNFQPLTSNLQLTENGKRMHFNSPLAPNTRILGLDIHFRTNSQTLGKIGKFSNHFN